MLPTLRQRLVIATAAVLGGLLWLLTGPTLQPGGGGGGYSFTTAQGGWLLSIAAVLVLGVPVLVMGLAASTVGHPLSGMFAVGAALGILAGRGGPIDGWLRHAADVDQLPGGYGSLILEMLIWQFGIVLLISAIGYLRSPMRARWPALAFEDHLGIDTHLRFPQTQAILAGLVAALVAGVVGFFLIRSSDVSQILWALVLAFTAGGCVAQLVFPQTNPVGILFSPAVVAIVAYAAVMLRFQQADDVLHAWYSLNQGAPFPAGLALALPIHYTAAGIVGCTLGVGLAQSMEGSHPPIVET